MTTNFYFQNISQADKNKLKAYLTEKKLSRLVRLLRHGNLGLANLRICAGYFKLNNAFLVKMDLAGIGKQMFVAEERSHNIIKGFDLALDRLISQLRKLESKLRDK